MRIIRNDFNYLGLDREYHAKLSENNKTIHFVEKRILDQENHVFQINETIEYTLQKDDLDFVLTEIIGDIQNGKVSQLFSEWFSKLIPYTVKVSP